MTRDNMPDHGDQKQPVAVALSHERGSAAAPVVTATGRGELAQQILNIAFDNNVKVREDADLANILSQVDVDTPIPLEAFAAVSEILAYLYRSQNVSEPAPGFVNTETEN
jgi:flagellar biosynthesis protein